MQEELYIKISDAMIELHFGNAHFVTEAQKDIHATGGDLLLQTNDLLKKALALFNGKNHMQPKRIRVLLGAPWYASQTRTINYQHPETFHITRELVDNLITNEHTDFVNDMERSVFLDKNDTQVILSRPIAASVDGKTVDDPANCKGKTCTVELYVAIAPSRAVTAFTKTIRESLPSAANNAISIAFEPFAFVLWQAMRKLFPKIEHYAVLDIGTEITDMVVVRNDVISGHVSFPYGKANLLRSFAQATNTSGEHARSLCRLYQHDKLDKSEKEKIDRALSETEKIWRERVHNAKTLLGDAAIPPNLFVLADADCAPWFMDLLQSGRHQLVQSGEKINVVHINTSQLFDRATIEK